MLPGIHQRLATSHRTIHVEFLQSENEGEYEEFVNQHAYAPIFFTLQYRNFLQSIIQGEPYYLIARQSNSIVGVFPAFANYAPGFGKVINSLPWYGSHGGCILRDTTDSSVRLELLSAFSELASQKDVLASTVIPTPREYTTHHLTYMKILPVRTTDRRVGQVSSLPRCVESVENALLRQVGQKTRNLVRKSLKQGFLEVVSDEEWAWEFLQLAHSENMSRIGANAKPLSHFRAMRRFIPSTWRRLSVAMLDGVPVAALLILLYKDSVEYFTPVVIDEYRSRQPLSFLIWRAMIDAVQKGAKTWNWGGTWQSQTSLHHFKAGWGAVDHQYLYYICASDEAFPLLCNETAKMARLFPYYYIYPYAELS